MDFSFLDNVELSEVTPAAGRVSRGDSNPENADLRVFSTGEVYPSKALVEEFDLEFQAEGSDVVENGFDLIDSKLWGMLPDNTPRFLAIATVPKNGAKAGYRKPMLFGKCRKKDGKPIQSVVDQGSTASGKLLLDYLEEVLGVTIAEGANFVDLNIVREHKLASPNGVYNLPYTVRKGDDAGALRSVRRENCEIFPLIVAVEEATDVPTETPVEELN